MSMDERSNTMEREKLAAAFTEWQRRHNEDPETFSQDWRHDEGYGDAAADYLLKLLAQ
jgi:hypothetical protein